MADVVEAEPDSEPTGGFVARLEIGLPARRVDVGTANDHTVTPGVLHQRVRRVEAHGLGTQQAGTERGRVVVLEPARRVHDVGEAHRVALGKAVAGERDELLVELIGDVALDAVDGHPLVEPLPQAFHALDRPLRAHCLAQLVGLRRGEAGDVDRHLHELLLEQRHPEGLGQGVLEERVEVGDGFLAVAPPDVGVHRPTLDGAGADERHLDHQVVERAGPQAGQRGHLGPGLDLEHPDGVGLADHVVHVVVLGELRQVDALAVVLFDEVERLVQGTQHAEAQQVELHEPDRSAVLLVPLQDRPVLHATPLGGTHLDDGPVTDDHAARMDAEVTGKVQHLVRHLQHDVGNRHVVLGLGADLGEAAPPVGLLRPGILLARRVPERPRHVADRRLRPVGDHVGDLGRVGAVVPLVDVLDDLFAPVRFDVDVDIGRPVALG